jgi:hypothetical protein
MQTRSVALSKAVLVLSMVCAAAPPLAGRAGAQDDPFGLQSRADAASQMIVLGVQQGISSLPPTSGQAFAYDYNAELGSFVESEQLGPTVLRSTTTIGANKFSLRGAVSYFDLSETFDPINYAVTGPTVPGVAYTKFGMVANARVVLLNFAATYGFTDRIEATVNFPVTVVDAQASQIYTTFPPPFPPPQDARIAAVTGSVANLNAALAAGDVVLLQLARRQLQRRFARRPRTDQRRRQGAPPGQ